MKVEPMDDGNHMAIYCPGCKTNHFINVKIPRPTNGAIWGFNYNFERPTFTPSIDIKTGIYADPNWIPPNDQSHWNTICHFFIRDGFIQYLNDCTHDLKGKTIELNEIA